MENNAASYEQNITLETFRDKVYGCWTGKNIGGTLGVPFEGKQEMNAATFYTQELKGNPAPNDDLDLQLIWLQAAEENGLYRLTPRLLGEYWVNCIVGHWNEYSVCKANIANGLYPPLSGSCNNDIWKFSNGAWIRSEIWACLFPGSPDEAAAFAYMDSCCDHCGEGIYAEVFTASMQAAAFFVSDVRKLIEIGLSKVPADCRIAQSVKLACSLYDARREFQTARDAMVKDSADLGWFQAPGNIGFVILGLLYGEGDFGKSICLAVNCGDDTDCTGATVGALLGIINGRTGIPKEWTEPIGETIQTVAINPFGLEIPKTLGALTDRVIRLAVLSHDENTMLPRISREPSRIHEEYLQSLVSGSAVAKRVWEQSPYALVFDLPFAKLEIDYTDGPSILPDTEKRISVRIIDQLFSEAVVHIRIDLPESWRACPAAEAAINCIKGFRNTAEMAVIPGAIPSGFLYIPLTITLAGRFNPVTVQVPFQMKNVFSSYPKPKAVYQDYFDRRDRRLARTKANE